MTRPWRFLMPVLVFAALAAVLAIGLRLDPNRLPSPLIGKRAPDFSLESLGDPAWKVGTTDMAGRAWVLNVWGTWCPPCRDEHPTLVAIARENRVPLVGLNWNDDRALALRWLAQLGNPYVSVAYDPEGQAAIDWGVTGAPETFLIDADGVVVKKFVGPLTMEVWREEFLPLLATAGDRS
jgi:cytochrome c biogenesis protein CcmG/thiol:disulfide interchange protein DsbE